ncbi:hypothetical protein OVY48_10105 [Sphingobium sp. SA2]|uniref:hypothetical protein n=1 Tax=Sphingobium sp. SA2 TaxID=1524832 RepID=UPI0028BF9D52|nr:hypothetical protein [Sphingobium sp. SA2]MDT7533776.1 hypothetical protein [Sphingobium sp. SA2]
MTTRETDRPLQRFIDERASGQLRYPQNLHHLLGHDLLNFGLVPKTISAHAKFILGQNQKIKFNDDVVVQLVVGSTAEPGVKYESQSVLDLTEWLGTSPAYRDNDKQFTLKIDRTIKL